MPPTRDFTLWGRLDSNQRPTDYEAPMSSDSAKSILSAFEVTNHPSVHNVAEVAFESPHCLLLRMTVPTCVGVDPLGSRVTASWVTAMRWSTQLTRRLPPRFKR